MNENTELQDAADDQVPVNQIELPETEADSPEAFVWNPHVGEVVMLNSDGARMSMGASMVVMTVENVYPAPDPRAGGENDDTITLVEVTWLAADATLQRATFDQRALVSLEAMVNELTSDSGKSADAEAPKPKRGRPPGSKNKPKRSGKRKRKAR